MTAEHWALLSLEPYGLPRLHAHEAIPVIIIYWMPPYAQGFTWIFFINHDETVMLIFRG